MRKIAWVAAAGCMVAAMGMSATLAARLPVTPAAAPASESSCGLTPTVDAGCNAPGIDAVLAPELDGLDVAPPAAGLGFQAAASDPGTVLAAAPDGDTTHRVLPALIALGVLLVLLRKRPG